MIVECGALEQGLLEAIGPMRDLFMDKPQQVDVQE